MVRLDSEGFSIQVDMETFTAKQNYQRLLFDLGIVLFGLTGT